MSGDPMEVIKAADPKFFDLLEATRGSAFAEGGIPLKYKLLMAMTLDAANGAVDGVKVLAMQAMQEGATKEEVMEAVKIAQYIFGVGSVYTAANALGDIL
jgi:alkylhydroperoxidase/carboxymuconolactone decarboxylase family protein YurZ